MSVADSPKKLVIFALDQSPASQEAFEWMLTYHLNSGDELVLAHVHPEITDTQLWSGSKKAYEESFKQSQTYVEKQAGKARAAHVLTTEKVLVGDPRQALCSLVDELNATSLVMGARGMGALKRALLGSVSTYCVQYAQCPVTIIKSKSTNLASTEAEKPSE